jgi:hypothetical protein
MEKCFGINEKLSMLSFAWRDASFPVYTRGAATPS